jgi:hypothetical protein
MLTEERTVQPMNAIESIYSVSPPRVHDPSKGHLFATCEDAMAFVGTARAGEHVALWVRRANAMAWFKMGLLKTTRRGLRALRTTSGELATEPEAAEDPPAPLRTWGGGPIERVATLDYPGRYDDP